MAADWDSMPRTINSLKSSCDSSQAALYSGPAGRRCAQRPFKQPNVAKLGRIYTDSPSRGMARLQRCFTGGSQKEDSASPRSGQGVAEDSGIEGAYTIIADPDGAPYQ